jgi:hypothetical protein
MRFRILTSMLLMVFLSAFNSTQASAHGCYSHCGGGHHYSWGHCGYIYGPDGCYARHKACGGSSCCTTSCTSHHGGCCGHTYRRAHYYEGCCGVGHLHACSGNDCSKKCDKSDKDDKE